MRYLKLFLALFLSLLLSTSYTYANPIFVRIGLATDWDTAAVGASGASQVIDLGGDEVIRQSDSACYWRFKTASGGIYIAGKTIRTGELEVKPVGKSFVIFNGKYYRGSIIVRRNTRGKLNIINRLELDEYIQGVMGAEIRADWPAEAAKAQAIVARTYTLYNLGKHKSDGFDLCTDPFHCQGYKGIAGEHPYTNQAVKETVNVVMGYNKKVINSVYHSDSGGYTEDSENVWGKYFPYLRGVSSFNFETGSPYRHWRLRMTSTEFARALRRYGIAIGTIYSIVPSVISKSGRAIKLRIVHSKGTTEIGGERLRLILGVNKLRSTLFRVKIYPSRANSDFGLGEDDLSPLSDRFETLVIAGRSQPDMIEFDGRGWGHGVGLSQWGARGMALEGYNYAQILTHYYQGISLYRVKLKD